MDAALPETLDTIVTGCTQIEREARYQTMGEVCGLLGRLDDQGQLLPEPRRLTGRSWRLAWHWWLLLTSGAVW